MATLFILPLILGVGIAILGLGSIRWETLSIWKRCLIVPAVLALGLVIGALLSFAVFAPVYWLLGRLGLRRSQAGSNQERKS
jgi:hypothetical protein